MARRLIALALLTGVVLVIGSVAEQRVVSAGQGKDTNAAGRTLYLQYCASCHGKDGKGSGPVAPALKAAVPDLTTIQQREGGKFPAIKVRNYISGEIGVTAHGEKEMPVWGRYFRQTRDQRVSTLNLYALTKYVESIQVK